MIFCKFPVSCDKTVNKQTFANLFLQINDRPQDMQTP